MLSFPALPSCLHAYSRNLSGLQKRYTVSEKFAGQQGPCPHCKAILTIPAKEDEVVVHRRRGPVRRTPRGRR